MNTKKWKSSSDVEELLKYVNDLAPESSIREFTIEMSRRVEHLCSNPFFATLLEFSGRRASGAYQTKELEKLRAKGSKIYESLYPGHGAPSVAALAYSTIASAAFTESALLSAINGSDFAALAMAQNEAEKAPDDEFDMVHDRVYKQERLTQSEMLKRQFSQFVLK